MNQDSAEGPRREPSFQAPDPAGLEEHRRLDHRLMPLHRPDHVDERGKRRGKSPLNKGWRGDRSPFDAVAHMRAGGNVGVALGPDDLLVDCDERSYAEDPLDGLDDPWARWCELHGIDPSTVPTVETGRGGRNRHHYLKKPPGLRIKTKLEGFDGLEFKTEGTLVVAAGSVHLDTGRHYRWVSRPGLESPQAPASAQEQLERPPACAMGAGAGEVSPEELERMLDGLDVKDFRDQHKWYELMCACHYATAGLGREEFRRWCAGDPEYDEGDVTKRWDSLSLDKPGLIRTGTLVKLLKEAGRQDLIPRRPIGEDFVDDPVTDDEAGGKKRQRPPFKGDYMALARAMLLGRRVVRWNGDWYEYREGCYRRRDKEEMEAEAWRWLDRREVTGGDGTERLMPSDKVVSNVLKAAMSQTQATGAPPCWLPGASEEMRRHDPRELIPMRNGLLHHPTQRRLDPTPELFSTYALPFDHDPAAPRPARWLRLLEEMFPDEPDQAEALQRWTGYLLTHDTRLQKILILQGPPRSGKGTVTRVIQALLGEDNCSSPSVGNLASDFGLQALIGRALATITDLRVGKNTDLSKLAENLLRVSGEDSVSIQRKYLTNWEGVLPTRFMLVGNGLPRIPDTSGALSARLVVLQARRSFEGREDLGLKDKLLPEMPGILNWALDGLDLLSCPIDPGLRQPESTKAAAQLIRDLASAIPAFVRDRCVVGPGHECRKKAIYAAWEDWRIEVGLRTYSGGNVHFFQDLYEAFGEKVRIGGDGRTKLYGIGLRETDHGDAGECGEDAGIST